MLAFCAPVAQLDRALASEARGRVFESRRAHHFNLGNSISWRNDLYCTATSLGVFGKTCSSSPQIVRHQRRTTARAEKTGASEQRSAICGCHPRIQLDKPRTRALTSQRFPNQCRLLLQPSVLSGISLVPLSKRHLDEMLPEQREVTGEAIPSG